MVFPSGQTSTDVIRPREPKPGEQEDPLSASTSPQALVLGLQGPAQGRWHSEVVLIHLLAYTHIPYLQVPQNLCPLLLLPPIPPSIRIFSNESTLRMRWPKDQSFSFSIIPSKEIPGLISYSNCSVNICQ